VAIANIMMNTSNAENSNAGSVNIVINAIFNIRPQFPAGADIKHLPAVIVAI
jgi:hypothetical protein